MNRFVAAAACAFFVGCNCALAFPPDEPRLAILNEAGEVRSDNRAIGMGEDLKIQVTGKLCDDILAATRASGNQVLLLHLTGVPMAGLPVSLTQVSDADPMQLLVTFELIRNPGDEENRSAWERLLRKYDDPEMDVKPALSFNSSPPLLIRAPDSFKFRVATLTRSLSTLGLGIVLFLITFACLIHSGTALRVAPGGPYSLGKSQLAFWGLLVLLSFLGVMTVTGTMERIPAQMLILLGISGATGLGSAVVGGASRADRLKAARSRLEQEKSDLESKRSTTPPTFSRADELQLRKVGRALDTLSRSSGLKRLIWDICSDGNGLSFHRLQVVLWTIVLGGIFVYSVMRVISMPEFSDTLLLLLGVSNGTYLGFKFPEENP